MPTLPLPEMENPPDFRFACPMCQQRLACEDVQRGMRIECPACKAQISIPALLGLMSHASSSGHAFGDYSPPVVPSHTFKIRARKT
jgi:DNA-directed RNA polymerase subunit RPC12/RpoP